MSDVLLLNVAPANTPLIPAKRPFRFSSENAREFGAKGNALRWTKYRASKQSPPYIPDSLPQPARDPSPEQREEIELVSEQVTRMREQLKESMSPKDRAQLVRALDTMLDRRRVLRGDPLPGSRRPAPERKERQANALPAPS